MISIMIPMRHNYIDWVNLNLFLLGVSPSLLTMEVIRTLSRHEPKDGLMDGWKDDLMLSIDANSRQDRQIEGQRMK